MTLRVITRTGLLVLGTTFAVALAAPGVHAAQSRAFVVTTDFQTGGLSAIDLATRAVSADVASVYKDARARWYDGRIYVLNRFGADNVQILNPAAGYATVRQFSVGNGANPSDIVVMSPTKAYVSVYQRAQLQKWNPATGTSLGSIDLSAFADADGIPEADHMARFGRWLFVALQRLDQANGFIPTDSSLVVVIDTEADTVVDVNPGLAGKQAIVLARTNPVTTFAWDPVARQFHLGCVGAYGALDGGVVRIDPETFTDAGVAITEAALGGDVSDIEWHTATHGYAIVSDALFNTSLVTWNPSTGTRLATLFTPGGFGLADCARNDRGELYVCDNSFAVQGIRVFSTATDAQIAGPLNTGLPPYQVMFDGSFGDVLDVPVLVAASFACSTPHPNPARGAVTFWLSSDRERDAQVEVLDLAGRRVRVLHQGRVAAGVHEVRWDLRDTVGRLARPGVYLVRARAGRVLVVTKISVVE
jgi:DNA-binding beta-propeller fold protein YncE